MLRQWAGCYDITPDANPIVGPVDGIEHFYQASGFMGHGFMMAPIVSAFTHEIFPEAVRVVGILTIMLTQSRQLTLAALATVPA